MKMRHLILLFLLLIGFTQCKKYKDPSPVTDSRIANPYCNDPSAINYNWGFPGKPDNSVCIYPAQIYTGTYTYIDTFYNADSTIHGFDTLDLQFTHIDSTHLKINGFCGTTDFFAKANRYYTFRLDSLVTGGQLFCVTTDTISGNGSKRFLTDSIIALTYYVETPTTTFLHFGTATKK